MVRGPMTDTRERVEGCGVRFSLLEKRTAWEWYCQGPLDHDGPHWSKGTIFNAAPSATAYELRWNDPVAVEAT